MSTDVPDLPSQAPDAPERAGRRRGRRVRRAPILLVVVAALVAGIVVQQDDSIGAGGASGAVVVHGGASVPATDVASSAWYCAAGTSSSDGAASETVLVVSRATSGIRATVTVMPGGDRAAVSRSLQLAPGEEVRVPVADVLATAEPGVVVETVGGPAAVSHLLQHGDDIALESCTRTAATDWYFAAGTTVEGSQHTLALFNPFGDDAIVDVSFATDTGAQEPAGLQALVVPRRSRVTVAVADAVPRQARLAAHVHARTGRVVAEQTETFAGVDVDGVTRTGIALSAGARSPADVWRIPVGTTRNGGQLQLELANFGEHDASVAVKTIPVGGRALPAQTVRVPAQGVTSVDVTARVPVDTDVTVAASARADNGRRVPVVAEVLGTWPDASPSTGLAGTVGTTVTATRWVVPVPDVDADGTITVFNPGPDPVTAALLPADEVDRRVGPSSEPELAIAPGAAKRLQVAQLARRHVPMVVTANHPVVVGLTVLGNAGAAASIALPDFTRPDSPGGG